MEKSRKNTMETKKTLFEGKPYDAKATEPRIYADWEKSGFFNPDNLTENRTKNYIVYMPLPNVTGTLHMGHALDNTLQDILIRYYRMRGFKTLWLPGTDHAGIATQYVVEKALRKEGISRLALGREKFIERVWEWKKEYGGTIISQLKQLGCSADWSRERFTMDEAYARDVRKAFVHYHKEGYLYRGLRTVNWCPRCGTSLSELELEYTEEKTKLWYIRYPRVDQKGFLVVATTRPETILGDTAIAVNDRDERFRDLIGKNVLLPIQNREIPVVADSAVDATFGTGAVKVTPAHDITDFEIGQRHQLPLIAVIDEQGKMTAEAGNDFAGLKSNVAREKVLERLQQENLLEKEEEYMHRVSNCSRCGHVIEPIPSQQWFVKMKKLGARAADAVKNNSVKIQPENFERTYLNWLENVRDWTISRQIWWGHRLPVYFCEHDAEQYIVAEEKPAVCPFCKKCALRQSDDVLDTWFSSALWPFAGLSAADRKNYYPGNALITGRDIINLWVARMIFSGLEFMNEIPFQNVFIHGTILTKDGKRMSKSLGTGIDPLKYIETNGADTTRFAVLWQATGQDIHWDESAVAAGKKFMNKIWNAARFVLAKTEDITPVSFSPKTDADKKILTLLEETKKKTNASIPAFAFSNALKDCYDFFWHDFCDVYLETTKEQLQNPETAENTKQILHFILRESLVLLHPFLPFITEEIWGHIKNRPSELLLVAHVS